MVRPPPRAVVEKLEAADDIVTADATTLAPSLSPKVDTPTSSKPLRAMHAATFVEALWASLSPSTLIGKL
jgi:hypothetical protein